MRVSMHDSVSEHMTRERKERKNVATAIILILLGSYLLYQGFKINLLILQYIGGFLIIIMIIWYFGNSSWKRKYRRRYGY